ncbi:zona pellucida sperm-binding protein 3-like isoform X2 [Rhineura floridana]|uniref:zona pellucida sperm-binding protein 3-like isoform X2 n=1 Tax=Rhineura floridana TaxID=261503 RepID=UPI002AC82489|nr:zona pellucida sperm-binding protein 3-like isoform X2 [Rhineura floridana]
MGLLGNLAFALLCWIGGEVVSYDPWEFAPRNPMVWRLSARTVPPPPREPYAPSWHESSSWAWVDTSQTRALSYLNPVAVQCGEAQVVVTANRDLFGTGRLIQATDLRLGSPGCQYTSFDAAKDVVTFEVGLHECGSTLQMTPESFVYSISLYYKPTPTNAVIIRTSPAEVPIECHYPRRSNVSSKAIKPIWVPFSSTISAEQKLSFSLRLMNGDWSAERASTGYQLGDVMYIQADVNTENHMPLRLFVDSCVATLSTGRDSIPRYPIIDYKGCLVDGRSDSSSSFVSPRLKEDLLQFTVDVFRFTGHPQDLIYITCHLKVTAADQAPDPANKACSFNEANNIWIPVEGTRDICTCCETKNCGLTGGQPRRINPWDSWARGRRSGRDASAKHDQLVKEVETHVMVGPIVILDAYLGSKSLASHQSKAMESPAEHGLFSAPGLLLGLILMALALLLALLTLGVLLFKKHSGSP